MAFLYLRHPSYHQGPSVFLVDLLTSVTWRLQDQQRRHGIAKLTARGQILASMLPSRVISASLGLSFPICKIVKILVPRALKG